MTPVLTMDLNLGTSDPQASTFSFEHRGRYAVKVQLILRHAPERGVADRRELVLAGEAEILDAAHVPRLRRQFSQSIVGNEVLLTLFEFDSEDLGKEGKKLFRIVLNVDPEVTDQYASAKVYIRKEPKYALTY